MSVNEDKDLGDAVVDRETEQGQQANRFEIVWHGDHYGYRVSIPRYEGGEVVKAEAYYALREAAETAIETLKVEPSTGRETAIIKLCAALALVDKSANESAAYLRPWN